MTTFLYGTTFKVKTTTETIQRVTEYYENVENQINDLHETWKMEGGQVADYRIPLVGTTPEGMVITKMNKKPFGFTVMLKDNGQEFKIFLTDRTYQWKRVK